MNNDNSFWTFIAVFVIVLMGAVAFSSGSFSSNITGNAIKTSSQISGSEDVQIVKLKVQGANYILEPSSIKKGIPVRIEADMSRLSGCSRSIVISAFNIRKTLSSSDNLIEFTPDKAGTFNIACSMNMYRGTFTVLDSNGIKASYVEPTPAGGSTCGASGGGCGCGG